MNSTEGSTQRSVNFPDTLLVAHKFLPKPADPAHLIMHAIIWSNAQQRVVTESNAVCVWYDYEKLQKAKEGPIPSFASVIDDSISGKIRGDAAQ
jgi:phage I-like protein